MPVVRGGRRLLEHAASAASPDTVIVVGSDSSSSRINELSWRLDPGQQLVVAPQLVGVAGSRIHTRPVAGLPLIHVETPSYDGPKRFAKRAFDLVFAAGLLVVLAPLFVVDGRADQAQPRAARCSTARSASACRASRSRCSSSAAW